MLDLEELTVLIEKKKKEVCTGETWNNIKGKGKSSIRNFNETKQQGGQGKQDFEGWIRVQQE